ncbi:MAG: hypothetical protein UW97_C0028G0004 [Parcubacteria group bacterium GW2011_GWA2_45_15]|nr:MAG: hypothetical protein UW97_C0028G0004 [Parcubacteria group bacterium GW2011_GWA2_45_15]
MKRILIISLAVISIALIASLGWYSLVRDREVPLGEAIINSLPFGSEDNTLPAAGSRQPANETPELVDQFSSPTANLFRLSATPVAGAVVFEREKQLVVRYVDRATGHLYDVILPTETSPVTLEKTKVTNNTLPKIYEAYFRSDGSAVLLRYLKDDSDVVENLSLALSPPQATVSTSSPQANALYTVASTVLRGEISAVATGPGNALFYALKDTSSIVTSTFNGASVRTILTSSFTDWRLAVAGNRLIVYTKASARIAGYAYTLDTSNRTLAKILGPLNGLVAIPNTSGNQALYSYVEGDKTKLFAKNLSNNTFSEILPATLAEKCIWSARSTSVLFCGAPADSPGSGEPDDWYRGATHFSDDIWLFNTNDGVAQVLAEPKQSLRIDIDVIEPKLSPNEDYLVFLNKNDLSLWALRLEAL